MSRMGVAPTSCRPASGNVRFGRHSVRTCEIPATPADRFPAGRPSRGGPPCRQDVMHVLAGEVLARQPARTALHTKGLMAGTGLRSGRRTGLSGGFAAKILISGAQGKTSGDVGAMRKVTRSSGGAIPARPNSGRQTVAIGAAVECRGG